MNSEMVSGYYKNTVVASPYFVRWSILEIKLIFITLLPELRKLFKILQLVELIFLLFFKTSLAFLVRATYYSIFRIHC